MIRNSTFGKNDDFTRVGELARDTDDAIRAFVPGFIVTVERYAALGDTDRYITLPKSPRDKPGLARSIRAVLCVRAQESADGIKSLNTYAPRNFIIQDNDLCVYEPDGLTADTLYDLTFLVITE